MKTAVSYIIFLTSFIWVISSQDAYAVCGTDYIRDMSSGKKMTLNEVIGEHRMYKSRYEDKQISEFQYHDFLKKKYRLEGVSPDSATYDLMSKTINVETSFPLLVCRLRGTAECKKDVLIVIPVSSDKTKAVYHKDNIYINMVFHLNALGNMILDELRINFKQNILYAE